MNDRELLTSTNGIFAALLRTEIALFAVNQNFRIFAAAMYMINKAVAHE